MKKKSCSFYVLFLIGLLPGFSGFLFSQTNVQLFHCMGDLGVPEKDVMKKYGIQHTMVFDGRYIDPNQTGRIDSLVLVKSIAEYFPSPKATGMAVLDLEDENYRAIRLTPGVKVDTKFAVNEFIRMVRIAKNFRPGIKWGVYNVPYNTYYEKTDEWVNQDRHLEELLKLVDVFTPSLYDFYPESTSFADDKKYFNDNIQMILRLAKKYNKEVIPFIWHRWHDSNEKSGLLLIPENEFKADMNYIISANYQGKMISGLLWFGAQTYFYHIKPGLDKEDQKVVGGQLDDVKSLVIERYARYLVDLTGNSSINTPKGKRKRR
jgi:hypothetical protein